MIPFSVLDLSPIVEGGDAGRSLRNTLDLARHAERLGFNRYWLAEHHNMPGIASAATAVVIGHVAGGTSTIRVGSGGVMLPNHAPLVVAEQFGTLEALYPGRIDLGLGRAPGTDPLTARALRRTLESDPNAFPRDVMELIGYFGDEPDQKVKAVPGTGLGVPVWILGSSLFGAELAALLGLPYAFASHFAPAAMERAVDLYREKFRPSEQLVEPHVMLGINVFAADTDEEARFLMTSVQQSFLNLRLGQPRPVPPPVKDFSERLAPADRAMLDQALSCSVAGDPDTVAVWLAEFITRTGADELIIAAQIFDHEARKRSFEIAAQAHARLAASGAGGLKTA
jgi:luciferase family oxidoreductase group 1